MSRRGLFRTTIVDCVITESWVPIQIDQTSKLVQTDHGRKRKGDAWCVEAVFFSFSRIQGVGIPKHRTPLMANSPSKVYHLIGSWGSHV